MNVKQDLKYLLEYSSLDYHCIAFFLFQEKVCMKFSNFVKKNKFDKKFIPQSVQHEL